MPYRVFLRSLTSPPIRVVVSCASVPSSSAWWAIDLADSDEIPIGADEALDGFRVVDRTPDPQDPRASMRPQPVQTRGCAHAYAFDSPEQLGTFLAYSSDAYPAKVDGCDQGAVRPGS